MYQLKPRYLTMYHIVVLFSVMSTYQTQVCSVHTISGHTGSHKVILCHCDMSSPVSLTYHVISYLIMSRHGISCHIMSVWLVSHPNLFQCYASKRTRNQNVTKIWETWRKKVLHLKRWKALKLASSSKESSFSSCTSSSSSSPSSCILKPNREGDDLEKLQRLDV